MSADIGELLRDAANLFANLAATYESDRQRNECRLADLERKTQENRETMLAAAEMIFDRLR